MIGGRIRRALRRSSVMESKKSILQLLLFEKKSLIKPREIYETLSITGENCVLEGWRRKWTRFCVDFCHKYIKNKPCKPWTLSFYTHGTEQVECCGFDALCWIHFRETAARSKPRSASHDMYMHVVKARATEWYARMKNIEDNRSVNKMRRR